MLSDPGYLMKWMTFRVPRDGWRVAIFQDAGWRFSAFEVHRLELDRGADPLAAQSHRGLRRLRHAPGCPQGGPFERIFLRGSWSSKPPASFQPITRRITSTGSQCQLHRC